MHRPTCVTRHGLGVTGVFAHIPVQGLAWYDKGICSHCCKKHRLGVTQVFAHITVEGIGLV